MSKDDFDLYLNFKKGQGNNGAFDLLHGLEDRRFGYLERSAKSKEKVEVFAEEQFIRKKEFDEMRCEMPGIPRSTFLMVFSPDGCRVASTHGNHNIYITDIRSGKNIKILIGHPRTPWCIAFHPTSDQIVASGCLGGQVRIWDLSGGSEIWTTANQTVIASLAFHPNDRLLVIATFNEVYFWDWSQPEPFVHAATNNPKEKVRYVAFDKLGHKLITGIANTPQTRWERVRAPVPVPRQERCASPYRRRITQRLVTVADTTPNVNTTEPHTPNMDTQSDHPDRERRITLCYRNLVREYEQLVQRYLQLYRPPAMMDRGTDPMDESSRNDAAVECSEPSTSNQTASSSQPGPSTSGFGLRPSTSSKKEDLTEPSPDVHTHLTPSRIISVIKKPPTVMKGTQILESRKHKAESEPDSSQHEKRIKKSCDTTFQGQCDAGPSGVATQHDGNTHSSGKAGNNKSKPKTRDVSTQASCGCVFLNSNKAPTTSTQQDQSDSTRLITVPPESLETTYQDSGIDSTTETHVVVIKFRKRDGDASSSSSNQSGATGFRIRIPLEVDVNDRESSLSSSPRDEGNLSTNISEPGGDSPNDRASNLNTQSSVDELLSNIRRTAEEEVRNRILPIIRSVPANDRPELIRLFENSREHVRMRFRQMYPIFLRKPNRRFPNIPLPTTDSSSSEEDRYHSYHNRLMGYSSDPANSTPMPNPNPARPTVNNVGGNTNGSGIASGEHVPVTGTTTASNFNTALEQLVTSLLTEIERNETERSHGNSTSDTNTTRTNSSTDALIESSPPAVSTSERANYDRTPHYHEYHSPNLFPPSLPTIEADSVPRNPPLAHRLFQECLQMLNPPRGDTASPFRSGSTVPIAYTPSSVETPTTIVNTNTRTTNSTIYTSNSLPRRRFFSHRISAFMPTRVNYTRSPTGRLRRSTHGIGRGRLGLRSYGTSFALDELINYAERENSEDDPPSPPYSFTSLDPFQSDYLSSNENVSFNNIYTNILSDIVSSLSDIMDLSAATRVGERSGTSGILSRFSERLESIVNQSDTILRNLNNSTEMLANTADVGTSRSQAPEPTWSFSDQNFYVRDQRVDPPNGDTTNSDIFQHIFNSRPPFSAIAADHTYPRNLYDGSSLQSETVNPLMTCIHFTISHIQRQARLLRQRVDVIERMDRAVLEVTQLQLIRNMIVDLMRYLRTSGDTRSTGMSSVRQMMAGTRISDSSPQESTPEEQTPANTQPGPSSSNSPSTEQVSNIAVAPNRLKLSGRKTYPPSRLYRLARECRRRSILHFFSRRYVNRGERNPRQNIQVRSTSSLSSSQEATSTSSRNTSMSNFSIINSNTLGLMTRRFEHLLTEQMRIFTSPSQAAPTARTTATIDLGEHILSLRLHGCILRMNRILRDVPSISTVNVRSDPTAAVTHDGVARYGARHTLSLLVDSMTRYVEMGHVNISPILRNQMQRVLAMSLLLTELMLFIVSDSVPSPTGGAEVNLEREISTGRLCDQMLLRHRHNSQSSQLARSLRLMKVTMRRAQSALGQTYHSRRAMLTPRQATDRWQLLGCINRCLRSTRQRCSNQDSNRQTTSDNSSNSNRSTSGSVGYNLVVGGDWYNSVSDLVNRYATEVIQDQDDELNQPSTSSRDTREQPLLSDNSDGEEDEPEGPTNNNYNVHNSNLYRTNNMNLLQNDGGGNGNSNEQSRPWNVPSVQVNDIPVSEPSSLVQRIMTQRQRFAERVSELRSNPSMGLFRPRFLHPLYASVNPFDSDLDDPQREQIYDNDIITTVTPNHRIQAWDISNSTVPVISNTMKNLVVSECKIHNDASVDVAKDGTILVTLLPSGGYLNVTNRLGVYSLKWETLGQCLYTTSFEQNAVSVSLSPLSRHLVVGLASRIVPSERWIMARIFKIDQKGVPGDRLLVLRELEQNRDSRINCIRWLPNSGQGLIYATNTGQLVILS